MQRRDFMRLLAGAVSPGLVLASTPTLRLGLAWRGPEEDSAHHVGILSVDWAQRRLRITADTVVPSRAHGLLAEPGGGLLAVAMRPGRWLLRMDPQGRVVDQVDMADEPLPRRFGGHVIASGDGLRLYTTETDTATGAGRIGVRDARSLRKLADWSSHGIEPHQLLRDHDGHLVVANGGIRRDARDRKVDLDRMDSSLVRLHGQTGTLLGQWRLPDERLSLRHLAWDPDGLLGIALQAEHDAAAAREAAPALAVWDGASLSTPLGGTGYAGDITGVPAGGFVVSNAGRHQALWWHPADPDRMTPVAHLQRAYALAGGAVDHDVLIAAARGLARWHPTRPPGMLPWPADMAIDNHMVTLA